MIEKKYTDDIRIDLHPKKQSFKHVARSCKSYYDKKLLEKYLPPTIGILNADSNLLGSLAEYLPESTVAALQRTEFVNVFGRVVEDERNRKIKCLQYLYVWDYQAVPEHEADYEPVFVFLDGDKPYAIYE